MKKFVPFILILSLLVCFIPSYNFVVYASDSVSDDDVNGGGGGHSRNNHYTGLLGRINQMLINNGYVINDENVITFNVLDSILEQYLDIDLDNYVSVYDKNNRNDLPMIYDNFVDNNPSVNYATIDNSVSNYVNDYVSNNLPYHVYYTMPISTFFQYFSFTRPDGDGMRELQNFKNWVVPLVNSLDGISVLYVDYYIMASDTRIVHIGDLLDNYSFALSSGTFGNFYNLDYQTVVYNGGPESQIPNTRQGSFNLYSNTDFLPYDGYYTNYNPWAGTISNNTTVNFCYVGAVQDGLYASWHCYFNGSLYLTPDSLGSISFPVFNSSTDMQLFFTGRSNVYYFDKTVDLGDFGSDIDYSRLYDIISSSINGNSDNILDSINNVANSYLQEQIDLLHDINNALNDGSGQSWLRRIYGILDYNFPLTLQAFDDLQQAIQNISISGGGSDLSHINRVLDEINDKLGFMIEEPLTNADLEDMNDLKNLAAQKFPFCVFSDIVAISVILNQTPEQPHWQIPLKLPGSQSVNNIEVDLSWYEDVRDLVQGVFIFIFIVGLLALSVKVFSALKS